MFSSWGTQSLGDSQRGSGVRFRPHEKCAHARGRSPDLWSQRLKAITLAVFSLLMTMAPSARGQSVVPEPSSIMLAPGDAIRITVWRNPELSGEFPIGPDGSIAHPLYREIKVANIPLPIVEDRIRGFLSRFETTPAFVMLPLIRIIVAGEVRQPNIFTVPPGTTVVQAIALAGGPNDRGALDEIRVMRDQTTRVVDLTRPDGGATRLEVRSGDQIIVPRARSVMQDYVIPYSSLLAGLAAVASLIVQLRR